jgi:iron complex transport system permease protein
VAARPRRLTAPGAWQLPLLAGATALVAAWALTMGALRVPPPELLALLRGEPAPTLEVLAQLRAPRVAAGLLVGAVLGLAGAVMQGLFRNPLADPGVLGVSAGAALGAVATIVLGTALLPAALRPHAVALAAFAGAFVATLVVQAMATVEGRTLTATLLLAGIVVTAIAGAATNVFIFASNDLQLRDILFWTMGSLAGASWDRVALLALLAAPLLLAMGLLSRGLDAMILGEREAVHLGIPLQAVKRAAVLLLALAVGAAVAMSGIIGFVGIVAPHLVRLAGGALHRWVLPASALTGAALLTAADALARTVIAPAELPIGLVTALIGGPFFLALLMRARRETDG